MQINNMPRIKKEEIYKTGTYSNVEGYVDYERGVYVVTKDPDNVIHSFKPTDKTDIMGENISDIIKKYKPNFNK